MAHELTVWSRLALATFAVVAALPLCASIPREWWVSHGDAEMRRLETYSANTTRIWITEHADPRKRPLMETDSNGVPVPEV